MTVQGRRGALTPSRSPNRQSAAWLIGLTAAYAIAILITEQARPGGNHIAALGPALLAAMCCSFSGFVIRYLRWRWLLAHLGSHFKFVPGLLSYLAGFALTATPGKVGELLRIRQFMALGVPPQQVICCFILERLQDVIALLIISLIVLRGRLEIAVGAAFVVLVVSGIVAGGHRNIRKTAIVRLRRWHWRRIATVVAALGRGIAMIKRIATLRILAPSFIAGLAAWCIQGGGLYLIVRHLDGVIPLDFAVACQAIAMLVGAASLLPGGIGTTEATIAALLVSQGVDPATAALSAIAYRIATLWFATLTGLVAFTIVERRAI